MLSSGRRASASRRQQRKPLVQSLAERLRHRADVAVGEAAEKDPVQRPVHDADAVQVSRSDDHVGVAAAARARADTRGCARGPRPSDRCSRAVRRDGVLQAVDVRTPEAALPGAMHHLDAARVLRREPSAIVPVPSGDPSSTTSRRNPRAPARRREHRQVFAFVIRRNDDEYVHRSRRPRAQRPPQLAPDRSRESETVPAGKKRGRR